MCLPHLHAVVTHAAVGAAGRAVEVTGGTPLHADLDALDLHVLVQRCPEVVVLVLVFVGCWGEQRDGDDCMICTNTLGEGEGGWQQSGRKRSS